jgi:hypothetical protein
MDETEDFLLKRFTASVQSLMDSVREMIGASKLLRGRIESNDRMLSRIENRYALLEERLLILEREMETLKVTLRGRP